MMFQIERDINVTHLGQHILSLTTAFKDPKKF